MIQDDGVPLFGQVAFLPVDALNIFEAKTFSSLGQKELKIYFKGSDGNFPKFKISDSTKIYGFLGPPYLPNVTLTSGQPYFAFDTDSVEHHGIFTVGTSAVCWNFGGFSQAIPNFLGLEKCFDRNCFKFVSTVHSLSYWVIHRWNCNQNNKHWKLVCLSSILVSRTTSREVGVDSAELTPTISENGNFWAKNCHFSVKGFQIHL